MANTSLENVGALSDAGLTVALSCACGKDHQGQASEPPYGCGRTWTATTETDQSGAVVLRPADDPYLAEAAEAWRVTQVDQLVTLRAAAEKWTAGLCVLLGLLGLLGLGLAPDRIGQLTDSGKLAVASLVALAVAAGGFAVVQAHRAAYGWPRGRKVTSDVELLTWYVTFRALPALTARRLRAAVVAAAAALAALAAGALLTWLLPEARQPGPLVKVTSTDESTLCGTVLRSRADGALSIRRSDSGEVEALPLKRVVRVSPVKKC
ncbi:hypothetical protein ACWGDX_15690 [Streptomyces sp. NPDC055025]